MYLAPYSRKLLLLGLFAIGLIYLDQLTKLEISKNLLVWSHDVDTTLYQGSRKFLFKIGDDLPYGGTYKPYFSMSLNYVRNHGAAWGTLANLPSNFRTPFFFLITVLATGVIVVYFYITPRSHFKTRIYLALIFSGAIGNFIDRVRLGFVVDWIDARWMIFGWRYNFPNFNVADAAITIGIFMLILDLFINPVEKEPAETKNGPAVS